MFGFGLIFTGALLHLLAGVSVSVGRDEDARWHGVVRLLGWFLIAAGSAVLAVRSA